MTPDAAARALRGLSDALQDTDGLADAYVQSVLEQAVRRAGGHPTAQARMAASGMQVEQGAIVGDAGTTVSGRGGSVALGEVLWGSDRGSSLYRQFGPRQPGAWLTPTLVDPGAEPIEVGERWLGELLRDVG